MKAIRDDDVAGPIRSPHPDVSIPDLTLSAMLFGTESGVAEHHPALVDSESGSMLTYAELRDSVEKVAGALFAHGFGVDDVIALFAPNSPGWVVAFQSILRANCTVTSANTLYSAEEFAHQLRDSGAVAIFTDSTSIERVRDAAASVGIEPRNIFLVDEAPGRTSLQDLITMNAHPPVPVTTPASVAVLAYSSGTTGLPKAVMLSHRNLVSNIVQTATTTPTDNRSVILGVLPFFHIYGMTVILNQTLYKRATLVTMPRFNLEKFITAIDEHQVTWIYIAPPMAVALSKMGRRVSQEVASVEGMVSGAAPLDAALGRSVADLFGCILLQGYGMTELSPTSHMMTASRPDDDLGSIGYCLPNVECRIIDPHTGSDVETGAPGELLVRGPNVMVGYRNNPAATKHTLDSDGYLHTGDLATADENGLFHIVGRIKELIKYKGYQVAPAELEAVLLEHPAVADVAVVGSLDANGEEIPRAYVVVQAGESISEQEIMEFVAFRVAPYKKVRSVMFVADIPKSPSGKILRRRLSDIAPVH